MNDKHFEIFMNIAKDWEKYLECVKDQGYYRHCLELYKSNITHCSRISMLCKELILNEEFDEMIPTMENYLVEKDGKYKFNSDGIYLAYLCGLYHDIGRFYQIVKYRTKDDNKSPVDHGFLGHGMLNKNKEFDNTDLTEQDKNIIKEVIQQHNKNELYEKNPNDINYFINLVIDANKIEKVKRILENRESIIEVIDINDIKTKSAKKYIEDKKLKERLENKLNSKYNIKTLFDNIMWKRGRGNGR